ncbi:unnamed protein product [Euphydryas editha]|uniref:Uncharacterized protein n=1 Tax=Euphydryas editha TaxID=104508 RepID=A0AAU9U921_EUPED|nr:unnamed protein product [Euphydryas editha]
MTSTMFSALWPIILLDETVKMLEKILAARIVQHLEESGPDSFRETVTVQGGFYTGRPEHPEASLLNGGGQEKRSPGHLARPRERL